MRIVTPNREIAGRRYNSKSTRQMSRARAAPKLSPSYKQKVQGGTYRRLVTLIHTAIFENKAIPFPKTSKVHKTLNKGGHCDGVSGCDVAIPNTCGIFVWEQSYIIHRICLISTPKIIH